VPNGDRHATVEASIKSSSLRRVFSILNLTLYIRLTGLRANSAYMTVAEIEYIRFQDYFASRMTTSETAHFYLPLIRVTKSALKFTIAFSEMLIRRTRCTRLSEKAASKRRTNAY